MFHGVVAVGKRTKGGKRRRKGVKIIKDLSYRSGSSGDDHKLDVYRDATRTGTLPTMMYVHGGGFCVCSKETHAMMALAFARRGFVVFNINYRLAPQHPYPAAFEDASAALLWVRENAYRFGADPDQIVLAGESAGGNLVTALATALCYDLDDPVGRPLWESEIAVDAVIASCAVLQVSDTDRLSRRSDKIPTWTKKILDEMEIAYLGRTGLPPGDLPFADPLVILEERVPDRPLPPFFAFVGTRDPLLDDTRRLKVALDRHRVRNEMRIYPGEIHAFHAMPSESARECWAEQRVFLDEVLGR